MKETCEGCSCFVVEFAHTLAAAVAISAATITNVEFFADVVIWIALYGLVFMSVHTDVLLRARLWRPSHKGWYIGCIGHREWREHETWARHGYATLLLNLL
jgi:hypothetical protein